MKYILLVLLLLMGCEDINVKHPNTSKVVAKGWNGVGNIELSEVRHKNKTYLIYHRDGHSVKLDEWSDQ